MASNYKKLGQYIHQVSDRNSDLIVTNLQGVSITKRFIPSIANTIGTNMATYKKVRRHQFAYGPVTSRNGEKISVALLDQDIAIISQAYTVFEVIDHNELDPEYLMMWFRRPEFDRYARFKSHGSVREIFGWNEMCDVELPMPHISVQKKIVNEYRTITTRKTLNLVEKEKIEALAQTVFVEWFIRDVNYGGKKLGDYVKPQKGRNITRAQMNTGKVPVIAGGVTPSGFHNAANTRNPAITISASGAGAGYVELHSEPVWSSDSSFIDHSHTKYVYFVYTFLKYHQAKIYSMQEGTGQPHIYPEHIASIPFPDCAQDVIDKFEEKVTPMFKRIAYLSNQGKAIEELSGLLNANMINAGEVSR